MQVLHFDEICARIENTKWKTKKIRQKVNEKKEAKENMVGRVREICIKCEAAA